VIAVLFWNGNRDSDGRWFIADAISAFPGCRTDQLHISQKDLLRFSRQQNHVEVLRRSVNVHWPRLLHNCFETALRGLEPLQSLLAREHRAGPLSRVPSTEEVPWVETREEIQEILKKHGESVAGRLFQEFFAYLLALEGYETVVSNQVGVPDVKASGLNRSGINLGRWSREDAHRLLDYCCRCGDEVLADKIKALFL
jgi:hypothetical protein